MQIINKPIKLNDLKQMAQLKFGNLVKAVIDIDQKIICLNAELHADEEAQLIRNGSKQKDLWGINLYPEKFNSRDFIEFDSMINLRPSQQNLSRGIESKKTQQQIRQIINQLIV
ncbi:MAG: hypothetical protein UV54_C0011G0004 [Candidatus Beckwithbacteria bacterium GW2011_GWA2_43_10]|uniref:Uncharacterized protein n=1 Tax=Candidatus Beckwithbacteria bacterium GW2011_GWA2_43_10 TaxID=1618369 RepID=A0A0G1C3Y0_9BACT|nr:MAG: hypothetical protein UV54_C0011G0004 [Candidatus Beckwithbacteria bacterium GW2011_GWA2_43_10]